MEPKLLFRSILLFFISSLQLQAQVLGDIQTSNVSELDAVQTESGVWISASMEITPFVGLGYRVILNRSENNGVSWEFVGYLDSYDNYTVIGDPVMAIDNQGRVYLLVMEYLNDSDLTLHLTLYVSEDDGQTWNIQSQPYVGEKFADTPDFRIDGDDRFYVSYSVYNNSAVYPSEVHFIRSEDQGLSWTEPEVFEATQSDNVIGSNFNFSQGDQINLVFADYSFPIAYYTASSDFGNVWDTVVEIPIFDPFSVNKVVSRKEFESICVFSHRAHDPTAGIYYNYSLDNGGTWDNYFFSENASMAEGCMDEQGNVHVTYNHFVGNVFELIYVYSTDGGITFTEPEVVFSGLCAYELPLPNDIQLTSGESQSMKLGEDNNLHMSFVDWTDFTRAKHLVFEPFNFISPIKSTSAAIANIRVYPNPSSDHLKVNFDNSNEFTSWSIYTTDGQLKIDGTMNSNEDLTLDINSLQSGSYFLRFYDENRVFVKRFVKI